MPTPRRPSWVTRRRLSRASRRGTGRAGGLRSTVFLGPGLIAYIVMIPAVVSTALSIVREKERGTMEQVRMAPLDAASFVVGKTVPYFVVSLASAFAIILVA